jgi:solute carrier family 45 protein 1/2/4
MVCRDVQWLRKPISSAVPRIPCADPTQPYLLSLGISKSMLALVWIAGPLSGALVQPYVGMKSDNCRMKWGKRRPFIVGGAAATIVSLMVLAWATELMGGFLSIFGADREGEFVKTSIVLFAVLFVYVLDFAINVSKCYSCA